MPDGTQNISHSASATYRINPDSLPWTLRTGYCAAKFACVGYFESLRSEVERAYGVKVSVILPGSVRTQVAVNALDGKGQPRGRSDVNIDEGIPVETAAATILDGLAADAREILVAEGRERIAAEMRASNPEAVFALTADLGAQLAQQRGASPEPTKINS